MSEKFREVFGKAQDERKLSFDLELKSIEDDRVKQKESVEEHIREIEGNGEALIDEYKQKFEGYEEQVKNIVGIVNTNIYILQLD